MTVYMRAGRLDQLSNDSRALSPVSQSIWVNSWCLCEESICFFIIGIILHFLYVWPVMSTHSSWRTTSICPADLTAMFIDRCWSCCSWFIALVHDSRAALAWINYRRKLSAGIHLISWKYRRLPGVVRAYWSWRKSPSGFIAVCWTWDASLADNNRGKRGG